MPNHLVAFTLDGQRYALRLASVLQVTRMVEVAPLPKAPKVVLGVLNLHGRIIPVLSLRRRFGAEDKEVRLDDQLLIADTGRRRVALVVDSVTGVLERSSYEITNAEQMMPGVEHVEGLAKLEEGILFIHNLDRFLLPEEEGELQALLTQPQGAE